MKYVNQSLILAMFILLGFSRLYALDNESKTQELKQVLHRIVKMYWKIHRIPSGTEWAQLSYQIRDLVNHGANPSALTDNGFQGRGAIHFAAEAGDVDLIEFLLNKKVHVEALSVGNYTPLMWAAQNGQQEAIAYLLKSGADINAAVAEPREATPLLRAIEWMSWGGPIEEPELVHYRKNQARLMTPSEFRHLEIIALLIGAGANCSGLPFYYCRYSESKKLLSTWISKEKTLPEEPELHRIIRIGTSDDLERTLTNYTKVAPENLINQTDVHDQAPLDIAMVTRNEEGVRLLLSRGADPVQCRFGLRLASRIPAWRLPITLKDGGIQTSVYDQIYTVVINKLLHIHKALSQVEEMPPELISCILQLVLDKHLAILTDILQKRTWLLSRNIHRFAVV